MPRGAFRLKTSLSYMMPGELPDILAHLNPAEFKAARRCGGSQSSKPGNGEAPRRRALMFNYGPFGPLRAYLATTRTISRHLLE